MITRENYSIEHIMKLYESSKRDPNLIERVLFAFGLLEALRRVELPFIFKGGTSLLLLLDKPMRLSTDIDIIVEPGTEVDVYLEKAAKIFLEFPYFYPHSSAFTGSAINNFQKIPKI